MIYCNNCGSQIPDNAKYCQECGSAIIFEEPVQNTQPVKTEVNEIEAKSIYMKRSNWFYFWFSKFITIYVSLILITIISIPVTISLIQFKSNQNAAAEKSIELFVFTALIVLALAIYLEYSYVKYIAIDKKGTATWQIIILEFLKIYFVTYLLPVMFFGQYTIMMWIIYEPLKYLVYAILMNIGVGIIFDVPFGRAFHQYYWSQPHSVFNNSHFNAIVIIIFLAEIILLLYLFIPTTDQVSTPTQQPVVSTTSVLTKPTLTKQPTKAPTRTPAFAPTMHGINCKHFTQITYADIYQNICVYGRADRDYSPTFSWIVLTKGYRSIQLTSNVWVYDEYVPAGTCVVAYGRPQNNDNYITFIIHSQTDQSNIYDEPNAGALCDK